MPAGKGGRQPLEAIQSGELQFAINDISLEGKTNDQVKEMYLPDPPFPDVPCLQKDVLDGRAHHYCYEAIYGLVLRNEDPSPENRAVTARREYEKRAQKWRAIESLAKDRLQGDSSADNLEISILMPDLWYKDNIGGHAVTVMTSTKPGKCPKP